MFGELIGLWAAEIWSQIGAPAPVRLVELGPGRGALMADALRAARAAPDFFAAIEVHLVEASDLLAAQQRARARRQRQDRDLAQEPRRTSRRPGDLHRQ